MILLLRHYERALIPSANSGQAQSSPRGGRRGRTGFAPKVDFRSPGSTDYRVTALFRASDESCERGEIPLTPLFQRGGHRRVSKGGSYRVTGQIVTRSDSVRPADIICSQVTAWFLRALRERQGRLGGTAPTCAAKRVAFIRFVRPADVWSLTFSLRLYLITVGQIPPNPPFSKGGTPSSFKGGTEPDPPSGSSGLTTNVLEISPFVPRMSKDN